MSSFESIAISFEDASCGVFITDIQRQSKLELSFAMNKWPSFPSHLFLIGKSIRFNSCFKVQVRLYRH